jgi:uncharacterized protein
MEILFLFSLFAIAFLYSSVGHGGGSGYLALLALFGIAPVFMKSTSLTLNTFVSAIAFLAYYKAGYFRFRLILPFLITSVPFAYLGAGVHIPTATYKIILGVFLLFAVARLLFIKGNPKDEIKNPPLWLALLIGAVLGFFSGMIGIGGGIILSPLLILFNWASIKESGAASAIFIFLNSLSGLFSLYQSGFHLEPRMSLWIFAGIAGGIAGSYSGSFRFKTVHLRYILAVVLLVASVKLFVI